MIRFIKNLFRPNDKAQRETQSAIDAVNKLALFLTPKRKRKY